MSENTHRADAAPIPLLSLLFIDKPSSIHRDFGTSLTMPNRLKATAIRFPLKGQKYSIIISDVIIFTLNTTIDILGNYLKGPLARIGLFHPVRLIKVRIVRCVRVYLHNKTMQDRIETGHRLVPEKAWSGRFRQAISYLANISGPEELGEYLEFGVYNGTSLSCAYKVVEELGYKNLRFFGFDSFEGLLEKSAIDDDEPWNPKQFKCDIEFTRNFLSKRGVNWDRVFLLKGWFSDTLNQGTVEKFSIRKASVIMVDCDLYSSTVEVLNFCEPLIRDEAIIFFDDWHSGDLAKKNKGQKRAFSEFLEKYPNFSFSPLEGYSKTSEAFHITRICEVNGIDSRLVALPG